MEDGDSRKSFPIGIDNEFIGKWSRVAVEQGMLAGTLLEKGERAKEGAEEKEGTRNGVVWKTKFRTAPFCSWCGTTK